jgi:hypothetical protein
MKRERKNARFLDGKSKQDHVVRSKDEKQCFFDKAHARVAPS